MPQPPFFFKFVKMGGWQKTEQKKSVDTTTFYLCPDGKSKTSGIEGMTG
jgi:hypothetical protein